MRAHLRSLADRAVASDPGLLRLRSATTTVLTLASSLGILYGVTQSAGQSFTVALLGVVISMIASMALSDPPPRERVVTAGLMLAVAALDVTLGALLAPDKVGGDAVFVVIMAGATWARRFGPRYTIVGMVGFMTYFFALFLGATVSMLPWLIAALAIGAAVSLTASFVFRQHPDRQLRRCLRSLRARLALVVDLVGDGLAAGADEGRVRRRLRGRLDQVRETTLMLDGQLATGDDAGASLGVDPDQLSLRLFDLELAAERLAICWSRAPGSAAPLATDGPDRTAGEAVRALGAGLRRNAAPEGLQHAAFLGEQIRSDPAVPAGDRALALAVVELSRAATQARLPTQPGAGEGDLGLEGRPAATDDPEPEDSRQDGAAQEGAGRSAAAGGSWVRRLSPSSRQAVQVALASSLAIVAGELLSSARWYWAVIAAFVIYSGTSSRGETLAKGAQRIVGTIAGVAIGAVVASLVSGDVPMSLALIFVSLFGGFYLMKVSYAFMVVGTTTMLALLYGLLGEFSIGLLVTRIEETAIGAGIGILCAAVVLPTRTRTTVRGDIGAFLGGLSDLLGAAGQQLAGEPQVGLRAQARDLDRRLATLQTSAAPLTSGLLSPPGRASVRHALRVLQACDHYARGLIRVSGPTPEGLVRKGLGDAARQVGEDVTGLAAVIDHRPPDNVGPPVGRFEAHQDPFDSAQLEIDSADLAASQRRALSAAVRYLGQIDLAVLGLARDLTTSVAAPET